MSVIVKESTLLCPAEETPRHTVWLSCLDLIMPTPYTHSPIFFIYGPDEVKKGSKTLTTQIFKESMRKVLVPFYPVAGRLKENEENGRIEIDCNAAGVSFVEVETTHSIADFGDFKPSAKLRNLVIPTCDYSSDISSFPLLLIQITRFKCGGVCIGYGIHHHVADGIGFAYMARSLMRIIKGLELEVYPVHDRAAYLAPRDPPQATFQHLEYESPLPSDDFSGVMGSGMECRFKLCKRQIKSLKLEAAVQSQEAESYKLSTYEVVAGHVWRSACKARGLIGDECVKLYMPTDGRPRLQDPSLPEGYFGNVIFFTACTAKASDITCKPQSLWYAARKVHEALKKVENAEYLKSAIDYLEMQSDISTALARGLPGAATPYLSINSWGRLRLEADFGWGNPKFIGHGGIRLEGQSFLVQSPNGDGSCSLNIKLSTLEMPLFEKYFYDFKNYPNL